MFRACLTPAVRFCWNVLRSFTPVSFPLSGKERRLAVSCVPIPPGVGIAFSAFSNAVRLSNFAGSLRDCPFLAGDPDGDPEEVQEAIGKPPGGRTSLEQKPYPCAVTRNADAVRRNRVASRSCSSGAVAAHSRRYRREYAGAARPRLRQRVFDSLDSLHLIRGVGALGAARALGNNKGLSFVPTSRSTRVHGETCPSPIYARAGRAVQR